MLTVYGATLTLPKAKDAASEIEQRELVGRLIEPWLERTWPESTRTNTTQVTARSSVTDKVFRLDISEQHPTDDARQVTLVSMFNGPRGELFVDIRREVRPTGLLILPRSPSERPPLALTSLVSAIAGEFRIRDAQQTISEHLVRASSITDGAALAALIGQAPSRRLPVVVECTSTKGQNAMTSNETARALIGIAHVCHLATLDAERGFNDQFGTRQASSSWVVVAWPRAGRGITTTEYAQRDDERLVSDLIAAAVGALLPLPRPTSRSQSASTVPIQQVVANTTSPEVGDLRRKNQELEQLLVEVRDENDSLIENLTVSTHQTAKIVEDRDRYLDQLTQVLSLQADASQWNRTSDVVQRARGSFASLDFHPDVDQRLGGTQFTAATNQRIFKSLLELNNLAARLRRGDIEPNLFNTYCAENFNFAPSVSDNAINKFGQDYTIIWKGLPVQLGPHIRCNEARIYFYVDAVDRRVVIGHVGSHLRDKSTN